MSHIASLFHRRPLIAFFVLAYAITWLTAPFILVSAALGLLGLMGPAAAAFLVVGVTEGRPGLRALLFRLRLWRAGPAWYVVALGLSLLVSGLVAGGSLLARGPGRLELAPVSALSLILFVLVLGEEIGWRGYALPRLLEGGRSPLSSSILLGVLWGAWHLPMFLIPGMPQYGTPALVYLLYTTALAVLFTWLHLHTRGSVLLATLFHGSVNTFQIMNPALSSEQRMTWLAIGYALAALAVVLVSGSSFTKPRRA